MCHGQEGILSQSAKLQFKMTMLVCSFARTLKMKAALEKDILLDFAIWEKYLKGALLI